MSDGPPVFGDDLDTDFDTDFDPDDELDEFDAEDLVSDDVVLLPDDRPLDDDLWTSMPETGLSPPSADPPPADGQSPVPIGRPVASPGVSPAASRRKLIIGDFDGIDEPPGSFSRSSGLPAVAVPASPMSTSTIEAGALVGTPSGEVKRLVFDGTDDLPDAIVLSEARREGAGLRIGDDSDEILLPEARPKMDPRVRSRRISVRRGAGRKRLRWLAIIGLPVVLIVGAIAVLSSSLFAVKQIDVTGNVYTTDEELATVEAELLGKPVLTIDTRQVEGELARLPWVRRASVQTDFPSSVHITLVERAPAASFAGADGLWRVIDVDGSVIAVIPGGGQPATLLGILGAGPNLAAGDNAGTTYQTLAQLAATVERLPTLRPLITGITLVGADIGLRTTTTATISLGNANDMRAKLAVLLTVLADPKNSLDKIVSINVSDPTKPAIH